MEVVTGNEPPTRIRPGQTHEIGRAHGLESLDKTISRRHLSLSVAGASNGEEIRLQFEVLGRNPIYVHRDNKVKIFRRFERGEMGIGDMFCVSGKNPVWYSVRRIEDGADGVRRNIAESELGLEMDNDFGFKGVEDLDQFDVDISGLDPVKEFGFVVEDHEFDAYPKKMIIDIKNWDWFLEEDGRNEEDDEAEKVKAHRSGKRKKGAKNGDDDDEEWTGWTGESEDERELTDKSGKAPRAKYTTRSKDHGKSIEASSTSTKNEDVDDEDEVEVEDGDEGEDDETLGGFVVDDENMEKEEEEDEELEEEEEEEEDYDDEDEDE